MNTKPGTPPTDAEIIADLKRHLRHVHAAIAAAERYAAAGGTSLAGYRQRLLDTLSARGIRL